MLSVAKHLAREWGKRTVIEVASSGSGQILRFAQDDKGSAG